MTDYIIHKTDINAEPIEINEATKDTSTDVSLFGRVKLEYGQELNENILHILENFACPETAESTIADASPDQTANGTTLSKPVLGQIWYNSSRKLLYYWDDSAWIPLGGRGHYNANWGQIGDGGQIPKPVNPYTGEIFEYSECIWAVSPANIPSAYTYMLCTTDNNAVVTMKYRPYGENTLASGTANFLIISIIGNQNNGSLDVTPLTPAVSMTPTATPTPTHTSTPTHTPVVSPTSTPVVTPTPAATSTPAASPTKTPLPSPTKTPTRTPAPTPSVTPSTSVADPCSRCTSQGINCCVSVSSFLPDGNIAGNIKVGDIMQLADEVTLEAFVDSVSYSEPSMQDSVLIITESGAELECSKTAPIPTKEGILLAPDVYGKYVAVNIEGKSFWDLVVDLKENGIIQVQHITVNNKSFWAGKNNGSYILHHNIKCCYCGDSNCDWTGPNCCDCG